MRESVIEQHLKNLAQSTGGMRAYKWVCPGVRGVPDQILLAQVAPEHLAIVARYVRFVEVKAPGEEARLQQQLRHGELRVLGFTVEVIDSKHEAVRLVDEMLAGFTSGRLK